MIIKPIKTPKIKAGQQSIFEVIDKALPALEERSVVAITSKIIALCENRVASLSNDITKLVEQESSYYLLPSLSKYGLSFTITHGTLIPRAGIDKSNGDGNYVLWPADPQKSANDIREYLVERFNRKKIGVVITDSTARPLHYGTEGVCIAYSGFAGLKNYIGQPDLFGRKLEASVANLPDALAAAGVLMMGEASEQTPMAVIEDVPFLEFQDRNPTKAELKQFYISPKEEDLFAPFLNHAKWLKGQK